MEIPISVLSIDASIFIWISREFVVHCIWKLDLEPPWFKHLFSFSCFISPDAILHVKSQQGYWIKLAGENVFKSLLRCSNMYVWIVVKKTVCFLLKFSRFKFTHSEICDVCPIVNNNLMTFYITVIDTCLYISLIVCQ